MDKDTLISDIKEKHPEIGNLSDRTWDDVASALIHLVDGDMEPVEAMVKVFKTISGQLHHEVSVGLQRALEMNGCENRKQKQNVKSINNLDYVRIRFDAAH